MKRYVLNENGECTLRRDCAYSIKYDKDMGYWFGYLNGRVVHASADFIKFCDRMNHLCKIR